MKITKDVLQSVYKVTCGGSTGTAFEIFYNSKYYLITAAHCIIDKNIFIFHQNQQKNLEYLSVKKHPFADIAVIELKVKLHGEIKLGEGKDYTIGENIIFLGFPYNLSSPFSNINDGFDIPLVKAGIVSGFNNFQIFIDAHNNPGFSGGPLLINKNGTFVVVGVISGYIPEKKELFSENSGIGYATKIDLLKETIEEIIPTIIDEK